VTAVLFTCTGQRVDIVNAFGRAGARTVATDANPLAPALYHADVRAIVPRIDDPDYIPKLAELVRVHDVKLIVPLTDLDHLQLLRGREELGTLVLLADEDVIEAVNDKYRAHELFLSKGIPSPPTWLPDALPDNLPYPVLVKAREGFGSRHIYLCETPEQLRFFLDYTTADSMVQQCCTGEEFSIDVFCDLEGRCLNAIPRTMIESKGGESIKGMTIRDVALIEHGRFVSETLRLRGPANIQCFRVTTPAGDTELQVTDINPRFGGPSRCRPRPAAATRSSRSRSPTGSAPSRAWATSARGS
jgi:carbamoyl-phosphate synthase large subunit